MFVKLVLFALLSLFTLLRNAQQILAYGEQVFDEQSQISERKLHKNR
jgi:hypothetical protein